MTTPVLLIRAGTRELALPLPQVREVMRALPIEPPIDDHPWLLGQAIVRGLLVPVISLARAFGETAGPPGWFVTIAYQDRLAALAVDAVIGVASRTFEPWQPLLAGPELANESLVSGQMVGSGHSIGLVNVARLMQGQADRRQRGAA